jgi:glycosyltransferase involved in cell wall biosynthesis
MPRNRNKRKHNKQQQITHILWVSDFISSGYSSASKALIKALEIYSQDIIKDTTIEITLLVINHGEKDVDKRRDSILTEYKLIKRVYFVQHYDEVLVYDKQHAGEQYSKLYDYYYDNQIGYHKLIELSTIIPPCDYLFSINDNSILQKHLETRSFYPNTKYIAYMPIDSANVPVNVTEFLQEFDLVFTMNEFSRKEILRGFTKENKNKAAVLPHILDSNSWYRMQETLSTNTNVKVGLRRTVLNNDPYYDNHFIILNINVNTERKRLDHTIDMFARFHEQVPNSLLILKTKSQGFINIPEYIQKYHPKLMTNGAKDIMILDNKYETSVLNALYNISDLVVSTATGEGWGFLPYESVMCGTKVLIPNNTSYIDDFSTSEKVDVIPISYMAEKMGVGEQIWKSNTEKSFTYSLLIRDYRGETETVEELPLDINILIKDQNIAIILVKDTNMNNYHHTQSGHKNLWIFNNLNSVRQKLVPLMYEHKQFKMAVVFVEVSLINNNNTYFNKIYDNMTTPFIDCSGGEFSIQYLPQKRLNSIYTKRFFINVDQLYTQTLKYYNKWKANGGVMGDKRKIFDNDNYLKRFEAYNGQNIAKIFMNFVL